MNIRHAYSIFTIISIFFTLSPKVVAADGSAAPGDFVEATILGDTHGSMSDADEAAGIVLQSFDSSLIYIGEDDLLRGIELWLSGHFKMKYIDKGAGALKLEKLSPFSLPPSSQTGATEKRIKIAELIAMEGFFSSSGGNWLFKKKGDEVRVVATND